ncbi:ABC transporter permease [Pyxidicoccus parkwayensis]|uniref:ABC transporter permease n=1 Tax=Pyxidicoccus parkwayensis TaxID=2813578 RepID=A0ABX7P628_9BACT|nr:ABC transporter permease [Pyxidicoccus parkwaysis]QSQ25891.1 ABC transporter permease [Pyxidicoccus parkwaysis]
MPRSSSAPQWKIERAGDEVRFAGIFRTADGTQILAAFRDASKSASTVDLDLAEVQQLDSGVVMLLLGELAARGARANLRTGDRFRPLFELCMEGCAWIRKRTRPVGLVEQIGLGTTHEVAGLDQALEFVGEMTFGAGRLVQRAARAHWRELPVLVERAGVDALPVVLILNFLLGFVTAFMSARVLALLGANLLVANLVSIAVTRQLSPLMTAIIVCGRSGAAYAAELGSMRVAEEIDALRTLGLEPFSWLVLPRVLALMTVTPVLTLLADLSGILGGLVVAVVSLGLTPRIYFNQTRDALELWDIESGLWMSVAFALFIGLIACQQGMAASGGATGVGRRTTQTVVHSLFAIIFLDAAFTVLYRAFGLS